MLSPIPIEAAARLIARPALPDAEPVIIAALPAAKAKAEALEKERSEAWHFVPQWRGVSLHPHSLARDALWRQLLDHDMPGAEDRRSIRREIVETIRLLYLLATPAQALQKAPAHLIDAAEAWADENVSRSENRAAVELVRRLRRMAFLVRARVRATGGRGEPGAVPCFEASYAGLLSAAFPSATLAEVDWHISLPRGWSLIHAHWVRKGLRCTWLDARGSKTARWLEQWRKQRGL